MSLHVFFGSLFNMKGAEGQGVERYCIKVLKKNCIPDYIVNLNYPKKLTWQCRITHFNRRYIFKWFCFHCHICFRTLVNPVNSIRRFPRAIMCHPFFSTSLSSRHRLRLRSNDRVIQDVLKQIGSGKLAQNCATGRSMMILDDTGCLPTGQRQEFWTSKVGQASKRSVRSLPPAGFFQWAVETYRPKPIDVLRAASQSSHFRFCWQGFVHQRYVFTMTL